jgi:hypothetical protein
MRISTAGLSQREMAQITHGLGIRGLECEIGDLKSQMGQAVRSR